MTTNIIILSVFLPEDPGISLHEIFAVRNEKGRGKERLKTKPVDDEATPA
jgi:hypothetical protein